MDDEVYMGRYEVNELRREIERLSVLAVTNAERARELEDAVRQHMADYDAMRPVAIKAADRELWKQVDPDGWTPAERMGGYA